MEQQEKHFLHEWRLNNNKGNLTVSKTGETYKCIWNLYDNPPERYIGLGMLTGGRLVVSRVKYKDEGSILPRGGAGIYRPVGDHSSNYALWANMQNFSVLGSGIAVRPDTSDHFEGVYKVRYFLKGHESPVYDLRIGKNAGRGFYALSWALNDKIVLHGVGAAINEEMALAWGVLEVDWELVILDLVREGDRCFLRNSCVSQNSEIIHEEILTAD